jgi:hypothetical protein
MCWGFNLYLGPVCEVFVDAPCHGQNGALTYIASSHYFNVLCEVNRIPVIRYLVVFFTSKKHALIFK